MFVDGAILLSPPKTTFELEELMTPLHIRSRTWHLACLDLHHLPIFISSQMSSQA
jgi:hypothetical protein